MVPISFEPGRYGRRLLVGVYLRSVLFPSRNQDRTAANGLQGASRGWLPPLATVRMKGTYPPRGRSMMTESEAPSPM